MDVVGTSESTKDERIGIGMDSAVIPLNRHKLSLVQSVDCFYPLVDDPHVMGKIALANVVSDVYAVGVTAIDKITLIMSVPDELTENERDVVVPMMINGFKESAYLTGCSLKIGSIAANPWCLIGGVATSICTQDEIIMPINAKPGDVLILTKPLGTQLATNAFIWMQENSSQWSRLMAANVTTEDIQLAYDIAVRSMTQLNLCAARLMHKFKAHAATDITGFGLIGHAENLVKYQKLKLDFAIDCLPIIANVKKVADILEQKKLLTGKAVETSGGLLISIDASVASEFCDEYQRNTGHASWVVGRVTTATHLRKIKTFTTGDSAQAYKDKRTDR